MLKESDEFDLVPEMGPWPTAPLAGTEIPIRYGRLFRSIPEFVLVAVILVGAVRVAIAFSG